jgi:cysteine desulfurase
MAQAAREGLANPASQHQAGRKARRMLESAREGIAELLGAKTGGMDADQVIFTSGGTEANNLALFGLSADRPGDLLISAIEHPSVIGAAEELYRRGRTVQRIPVTIDGVLDISAAHAAIRRRESVVGSFMLANNETGVIQPIAELVATCRANSVLLHTDAVQAVGKIPVNFRALGVDAMTIAPHKFHGPLGIGALIVRHGVQLEPQLFGGFQQAGLRPGTESVALAVGFHRALERWHAEAHERGQRMRALGAQLESELLAEIPGAVIVGQRAARLPHTLNVAFPGINRQALAMALDLAGVAVSTGSACASGSSEPSPVLLAMGLAPEVVEGSIRLSWGAFTTPAEMAEASRRILKCVKHLRTR